MNITKMSSLNMAGVKTPMARRYLRQLCKHLEHKMPVDLDEATRRIAFPMGDCLLQAADDSVRLVCEAPNDVALKRLEGIMTLHLTRFAFQETLDIAWAPAGAGC